jgi:SnoaL-like domain
MSTTTRPATSVGTLPAADHLAILNLYARYNRTIDAGDSDGWAACWTPDGVFDVSPRFIATGTEALTEFAKGWYAQHGGVLRHNISNVFVEAAPTGARGGAYLVMAKVAEDDTAIPTVTVTGIYDDELVLHDGEWRFSKRRIPSK